MVRKGEKIGWTAGWLGGFIWIAILSGVFLFQEKWMLGLSGLILICVAVASIILLAPWRHPSTPYWKLMLVPFAAFFASVAWAVWGYGGMEAAGIDWWTLFWFLPLMIPLGSLSQRRWSDFDAEPTKASRDVIEQ